MKERGRTSLELKPRISLSLNLTSKYRKGFKFLNGSKDMILTSSFIHSYLEQFEKINSDDNEGRLDLISSFWNNVEEQEYPLKEPYEGDLMHDASLFELVTFLYRSNDDLDNVFILAEFNHVTPQEYLFQHIRGTDIYYKSFVLPKNAQAQYRIIENDKLGGIFAGAKLMNRYDSLRLHPDPLSPHIHTIPDSFGPGLDMVVTHIRAHAPHIIDLLKPVERAGEVTRHEIASDILGYSRTINVYTPPQYDPSEKYPCLVLFDGTGFLKYAKANTILDNLIQTKKIKPVIAIFVDAGVKDGQTARYEEFALNHDFANSMANEVIPFVKDKYSLSENNADYVISGSSYGGLAAIYVAFEYPDRIRNVLSLSGSVHYGEGDEHELLIKQIAFAEPRDIVMKLYVGNLEGEYHWNSPAWANQLASHRHLETILKMKGYDFTYQEFAGDHSFASWVEPLVEGISEFFRV
ncbi:MAG: alpha/beta hydrolase [Candidatus Thorarchaeota archaeon]|jgi:enterochelin esterase family protein